MSSYHELDDPDPMPAGISFFRSTCATLSWVFRRQGGAHGPHPVLQRRVVLLGTGNGKHAIDFGIQTIRHDEFALTDRSTRRIGQNQRYRSGY